jgi:hypothetical protein
MATVTMMTATDTEEAMVHMLPTVMNAIDLNYITPLQVRNYLV